MNATATAFDEASDDGIEVVPPRGYKALCIANLLASSIASVLCIILIVAMTVPLLFRKQRKNYSTYNLYLAFMAIPDLVQHVFVVYLVLTHEQWNPHSYMKHDNNGSEVMWLFDYKWDFSITTMAVTWNLYVNAFFTHELYKLLRSSKQRKKHPPPTIARVTTHAMISYGLGIIIFFLPALMYILSSGKTVSISDGTTTLGISDGIPYFVFFFIYVAGIPLSAVVWFSYQIFRQELLRSTESMYEGRLRILVVYFARIVLSDLLLWIPACTLYLVSYAPGSANLSTKILLNNTSLLFVAFQSIVLFACSLFKPDVRKLIADLVCGLVYCRRGSCRDCETPRRCSVTDPYLWRLATPGREAVLPMTEDTEFEESQGSSPENSRDDNKDNGGNNKKDSEAKTVDRKDIDVEA